MRAECARAEACLPIGPIGQRLQQLLEILSVLLYFVQVAFHGFFVNRDARPHLGEGREHMCCSQRASPVVRSQDACPACAQREPHAH